MQDIKSLSDTELVSLSLLDADHFEHLVERYEAKLLRYIRYLSSVDQQTAEDILQEVFIKVYRNLNSFDQSLKFSSWIYRIAHNETISYVRKKHADISLDQDDEDELKLINIIADETDIPARARRADTAQAVREAVFRLPTKYRDVLVLKYFEEKTYEEIADIICKPVGTIGTLINRAKSKLRNSKAFAKIINHHD